MKKIDTSNINDTISQRQPFKGSSLAFLQASYQEVFNAILTGLTNYTTNQVIILSGCVITYTPAGATASITAGAIFYNGEVYLVAAQSLSGMTSSQIPLFFIQVTQDPTADPTTFTNGAPFSVHDIRTVAIVAGPAGGSGVTGYVCDYNSSSIDNLDGDWIHSTSTAGIDIITHTATGITLDSYYKIKGTDVIFSFSLAFSTTSTGAASIILPLPINGIASNWEFSSCAIDCSTSSISVAGIVRREFSGANQLQVLCSQSITGTINITGQIIYKMA